MTFSNNWLVVRAQPFPFPWQLQSWLDIGYEYWKWSAKVKVYNKTSPWNMSVFLWKGLCQVLQFMRTDRSCTAPGDSSPKLCVSVVVPLICLILNDKGKNITEAAVRESVLCSFSACGMPCAECNAPFESFWTGNKCEVTQICASVLSHKSEWPHICFHFKNLAKGALNSAQSLGTCNLWQACSECVASVTWICRLSFCNQIPLGKLCC